MLTSTDTRLASGGGVANAGRAATRIAMAATTGRRGDVTGENDGLSDPDTEPRPRERKTKGISPAATTSHSEPSQRSGRYSVCPTRRLPSHRPAAQSNTPDVSASGTPTPRTPGTASP